VSVPDNSADTLWIPRMGFSGISYDIVDNVFNNLTSRRTQNAEGWIQEFVADKWIDFSQKPFASSDTSSFEKKRCLVSFAFSRMSIRSALGTVPYTITSIQFNGGEILASPVTISSLNVFFPAVLNDSFFRVPDSAKFDITVSDLSVTSMDFQLS